MNTQELSPGRYARDVLLLGIGNILWADEGFGPRAAEAFNSRFRLPEGAEVMDGGTLGGWLVNEICSAKRILVFDCCDLKAAPGTLRVLRKDDIRIWSSTKISPHQTGFNDLLATAALMGSSPEDIAVVGIQPELLDDYGGSLTETVKARIPEALEAARGILSEWGFPPVERTPGERVPPLSFQSLSIDAYESGRPDEAEACRTGDERFLVRPAGHASDPS
ncbi:HyaD/HybD family hydrogenase maturation endopeptidase [uncultured Sutterella sp.]|uniref:HyaD/HybD family hydrogenase maturation endopeptidase n=1 Tax=uncultured Sutterella sp. TaxID=286133 RepID=UPI00266EFCE3|nr:HyaD/HybD family hydrogenase maturation endopeptidase [uncultured Sutterella sp.]